MKNLCLNLALFCLTVILTACATTPKFDVNGVEIDITPQRAVAEAGNLQGIEVLWGGIIIASTNLAEATQFEILAYPLASDQMPDTGEAPLGRFLALQEGYLETSDYAQGRLITVRGMLDGTHSGRIGESDYVYPVLRMHQHELWKTERDSDTQFHIGIGVMFHN